MRNLLIEITALNPITNGFVTLRASSAASEATGVILDGKEWAPVIIGGPEFEFSYWGEGQPKPLDTAYGNVTFLLDPNTGSNVWPKYSFEGANATVWVGAFGDAFTSYRKVWSGKLGPLVRDSDQVAHVPLLGAEADLVSDLLSATYAGTGGAEGSASLRGAYKPFSVGACVNVAPVLVSSPYWVYQVNGYTATPINGVYEAALAVEIVATASTYSELIGLTIPSGKAAACPSLGMFRLSNEPSGKITADIGAAATVGTVSAALMALAGLSPARIDASVSSTGRAYSLYVVDQTSILDEVRTAAFAGSRLLIPDSSGIFYFAPIVSTKAAGTLSSKRDALPLVQGDKITQEPTRLPAYKVRVGHSRVWAVHSISEISPAIGELSADVEALNAAAQAASDKADAAKAQADLAVSYYNAMVADGVLDRSEKRNVVERFEGYTAERTGLVAQAASQAITAEKDAYTYAYAALKGYLEALVPSYSDSGADTPIVANDFKAAFINYDVAKQNLVNALANKAAKTAGWTNVSGRPTNLADLNEDEGQKLEGIEDGATVGAPEGTDVAGKPAIDIVRELEAVATGGFSDTTPPPVPANLTLSSTLSDDGATLVASWGASVADDLAGYEITVSEAGGTAFSYLTTGLAWERKGVRRNTAINAKVRSYDKAGNKSVYSNAVSHTSVRDTVAPASPTGLTASIAFTTIFLSWLNPTDSDLACVEVWTANSDNNGEATRLTSIAALPATNSTYTHSGLSSGESRFYWLKAVDTSGNKSPFSTGTGAVKTAFVDISDVAPAVNQGLTKTVSTLPDPNGYAGAKLVLLSSDGKLYRYVDGKWTKAVATSDFDTKITGSLIAGETITGDKLEAGTIKAAQIGAGEVIASKLAVGNTDSVVTDATYQDLSWWNGKADGAAYPNTELFDTGSPWHLFRRGLRIHPGKFAFRTPFFPVEPGATYKVRVQTFVGDIDSNNSWFNPTIHMPNVAWYSLKDGKPYENSDPSIRGANSWTQRNYFNSNVPSSEWTINNPAQQSAAQWQFRFDGDLANDYVEIAISLVRVSDATLIADGAVTTNKITVNTLDGDRIKAGTLDAEKVKAGTVLSNLVTVSGTNGNIGDAVLRATDPAKRINENTTQIEPGKIVIQGGTSLNDWRDQTSIKGGAIKSNSVTADKLTINSRGINSEGIDFEVKTINGSSELTWNGGGYIQYVGEDGNGQSRLISGGSTYGVTKRCFVYWIVGENSFRVATSAEAVMVDPNAVMIATYMGGSNYSVHYGGTVINGERITTGSIDANRLNVTSLSAINANIGDVTAGMVRNSSGSAKFDLTNGRIVFDNGSVMKVSGTGFGSSNQFIEWFGARKSNLAECNESNASYYLKVDGSSYFGGTLSAGVTKNAVNTSSTAINAEVSTGQVGSRGGSRVIVVSYSWNVNIPVNKQQSEASGSGLSARVMLRRNGQDVMELNASGTWERGAAFGNYEPGNYTESMGGSITFTDNSGGTSVSYSAHLLSRVEGPGPQNGTDFAGQYAQTISIVQTEG